MSHLEEDQINQGFDKGLDYTEVKDKFIEHYNMLVEKLKRIHKEKSKEMMLRRIIYILIALNQLKNASRISESVLHFEKCCNNNNFNKMYVVKISKSEAVKYNKAGEQFTTKARFRNMKFPVEWVDITPLQDKIIEVFKLMPIQRIRKRVLDYLLIHFPGYNTHSLRYSCINYLLSEKKIEATTISKFVGHTGNNMIQKYIQNKKVLEVFDVD